MTTPAKVFQKVKTRDSVKVSSSAASPDTIHQLSRDQLKYSRLGLLVGVLCMVLGAILCIFGVSGTTSLSFKSEELSGALLNGAPGALLFIVGGVIVWVTRYHIEVHK